MANLSQHAQFSFSRLLYIITVLITYVKVTYDFTSTYIDATLISDLPLLASTPLLHSSKVVDQHVSSGVSPLLKKLFSGNEDDRQCKQLMDSDNPGLNIPVQPESKALQ